MNLKSKQVLVFCPMQEAEYLDIVLQIAQKLKLQDKEVTVLITDAKFNKFKGFFQNIHPSKYTIIDLFYSEARKIGIDLMIASEKRSAIPSEILNSVEFKDSMRSTLITAMFDQKPNEKGLIYRIKKRSVLREARIIFSAISEFNAKHPCIESVFVPNGRFLNQKLVKIFFERFAPSCNLMYYEKGFYLKHGFYYCSDTQPHERLAYQNRVMAAAPGDREKALAIDWFEKRPKGAYGNEFTGFWRNSKNERPRDLPRITLFTSSPDEFIALGPEWHESEWKDQWEAFDAFLNLIVRDSRYRPTLRVHPNYANKSIREQRENLKAIRKISRNFPDLEIFGANSTKNSYELISESHAVATWYSTIGLEAIYQNVPTISFNSGDWDNSVDVIKIFNRIALNTIVLPLSRPKGETALAFVAGSIALDFEMPKSKFIDEHSKIYASNGLYRFNYLIRTSHAPLLKLAIKALLVNYNHGKIHRKILKTKRRLKQAYVRYF